MNAHDPATTKAPPARLADISPTFKVAGEALQIAAAHNCDADLLDALFELLQREARKAEEALR